MDEVPDGSVTLIVTSPPYWNAIDYEVHVQDPKAWFRTRRTLAPYEEYLEWLRTCFTEAYRKQKAGGFCAVVIGTVLLNGKQYPLRHHFTGIMERVGYEFHQEIVWYKVTGGVKRAGVTIQNPYPGYYCPNIMTESILIYRKPGPKIYEGREQRLKEMSRIPIDELFTKELANDIWHIAPVPPNYLPHPCPFPEEIPYRLILLYSYPGDAVLDPFLGIGTTAKVARALGREYWGYEIQQKYYEIALKRLKEPLHLRDPLIATFEKISLPKASLKEVANEEDMEELPLWDDAMLKEKNPPYAEERANFTDIYERFYWLKDTDRLMISSPDLDGLCSSMLLHTTLGWELIGFYDANHLWLDKRYREFWKHPVVFVDHDIYSPALPSIGHHILRWSENTPLPELDGKFVNLNPNNLRGFTKKQFQRKYPFGTTHLLIALFSSVGLVEVGKPSKEFLTILLEIDSSLQSAFRYEQNALDWLAWLGGSDEGSPMYALCRAISSTPPKRLLQWEVQVGDHIESLGFSRHSQCHTDDPTGPEQRQRLSRLVQWLNEITHWHITLPNFTPQNTLTIMMRRNSTKPAKAQFQKIIATRPFSFAIISGGEQGLNYGYLPESIMKEKE